MSVRPIRVRDLGSISDMWEVFTHEKDPDAKTDKDSFEAQTLQIMLQTDYMGFVAEDEYGVAVGFVDGIVIYEAAVSEWSYQGRHSWVELEERGKGYGREMYEAVLAALNERDIQSLQSTGGPGLPAIEAVTGRTADIVGKVWKIRMD